MLSFKTSSVVPFAVPLRVEIMEEFYDSAFLYTSAFTISEPHLSYPFFIKWGEGWGGGAVGFSKKKNVEGELPWANFTG